jgi:hypothetical protein
LKPRTFFILVLLFIILLVAIVAGALASRKGDPYTFPGKVYSVTVTGDIGVEFIKITNQNTASSCTVLGTALPFSFNCTSGDTLTFNVTAKVGFKFNAWFPNDGTFHNQNPYTLKVTAPFSMRAGFIPTEELG